MELLQQVFTTITTTKEILIEFGKPLPNWVIISELKNYHYQEILEVEVDAGEASAIALYFEMDKPLLILDDFKARKFATKLSLNFTGTFGILLKAKDLGFIDSVKSILTEIQKTNFRFSETVLQEILKEAGEV